VGDGDLSEQMRVDSLCSAGLSWFVSVSQLFLHNVIRSRPFVLLLNLEHA